MDVMCLIDFCMSEFADVVCHFELSLFEVSIQSCFVAVIPLPPWSQLDCK